MKALVMFVENIGMDSPSRPRRGNEGGVRGGEEVNEGQWDEEGVWWWWWWW